MLNIKSSVIVSFKESVDISLLPSVIPISPHMSFPRRRESIFSFPSNYYSLTTNTSCKYFLKRKIFKISLVYLLNSVKFEFILTYLYPPSLFRHYLFSKKYVFHKLFILKKNGLMIFCFFLTNCFNLGIIKHLCEEKFI